jgi:hypothetical protein
MTVRSLVVCGAVLAAVFTGCQSTGPETAAGARGQAAAGASAVYPAAPMAVARSTFALTRLPDGRVLALGGPTFFTAEIYDPAADTWTPTSPVPVVLQNSTLALPLLDGRVLALDGYFLNSEGTPALALYDPVADAWTTLPSYPARSRSAAVRLADGRVLIAGGFALGAAKETGEALLFDPASGTVTSTGAMVVPRQGTAAAVLADGRVLLAGGHIDATHITTATDLYDPATGTFSAGPPMSAARFGATATPLADGRVLVAGGNALGGPDAELFDPATGTWTAAGPMRVKRWDHAAQRLADGRVALIAGSRIGVADTQVIELFDPATATFSADASIPSARQGAATALLADGRVLIAGGYVPAVTGSSSGELRDALIYDPRGCTPTTCADAGAQCGTRSDGCGGVLSCGTCDAGLFCSGNACGACQPTTCAAQGATCGTIPDGCGGTLSCGSCGDGRACTANQCACMARCPAGFCGLLADACAGLITCDPCTSGQVCEDFACHAAPGNPAYDDALRAPACAQRGPACSSGGFLHGRGPFGPERNAPNTLDGCPDGSAGALAVAGSIEELRIESTDGGPLRWGGSANVTAFLGPASVAGRTLELYVAADATAPSWSYVGSNTIPSSGYVSMGFGLSIPWGGERQAVRAVLRDAGAPSACPGGPSDDVDDLVFASGPPPCVPSTCPSPDFCGELPDGCGGTLSCACDGGRECKDNQCVCVPAACPASFCGSMPDGCGGTLTCDPCTATETCQENACAPAPGHPAYDATLGAPVCAELGTSCSSARLLLGRGPLGPEPNAPNALGGCADGAAGGQLHAGESIDALRISASDGGLLTQGASAHLEVDYWLWGPYKVLDLYVAGDAAAPSWTWLGSSGAVGYGPATSTLDFPLPAGADLQAVRAVLHDPGSPSTCPGGPFDDVDDLAFPVFRPPSDLIPPEVTLLSPADGALLGPGSVWIEASAVDDVGVVGVDLLLDDTPIQSFTEPPYGLALDVTALPDGPHVFRALARDAAGNVGTAQTTVIADHTPPTVSLKSPVGAVTGKVGVLAAAFDANGVDHVLFFDGTKLIGSAGASPWGFTWDTTAVTPGAHVLTARAVDRAGNGAVSAPITVTVTPPPGPVMAVFDATRGAPACATVGTSCDSGSLLAGRGSVGPEPHASNALYGSCYDGSGGTYRYYESIERIRVAYGNGGALTRGGPALVQVSAYIRSFTADRLDIWIAVDANAPQWVLAGTVTPKINGYQTFTQMIVLPSGPLQAVRAVLRYGGTAQPCTPALYNDVDDLVFAVQ